MKLTREYIFEVYGKYLKGDKEARTEILSLYKEHYPDNIYMFNSGLSKDDLHRMFLHLDQKAK